MQGLVSALTCLHGQKGKKKEREEIPHYTVCTDLVLLPSLEKIWEIRYYFRYFFELLAKLGPLSNIKFICPSRSTYCVQYTLCGENKIRRQERGESFCLCQCIKDSCPSLFTVYINCFCCRSCCSCCYYCCYGYFAVIKRLFIFLTVNHFLLLIFVPKSACSFPF